MKKLKSILSFILILFSVTYTIGNVFAYNLTANDDTVVDIITGKIEKLIDLKGESYRLKYIKSLEKLKIKYKNERVNAIIDETINNLNGTGNNEIANIVDSNLNNGNQNIESGKIDGVCGSAQGREVYFDTLSQDSQNLCASGKVTSFTNTTFADGSVFEWNWKCEGLNGGQGSSCYANSINKKTSRYPYCASDDIKIGDQTWASCDIKGISNWHNSKDTLCSSGYRLPAKSDWEKAFQWQIDSKIPLQTKLKLVTRAVATNEFGYLYVSTTETSANSNYVWALDTEQGPLKYAYLEDGFGVNKINSLYGMRCIKN